VRRTRKKDTDDEQTPWKVWVCTSSTYAGSLDSHSYTIAELQPLVYRAVKENLNEVPLDNHRINYEALKIHGQAYLLMDTANRRAIGVRFECHTTTSALQEYFYFSPAFQ